MCIRDSTHTPTYTSTDTFRENSPYSLIRTTKNSLFDYWCLRPVVKLSFPKKGSLFITFKLLKGSVTIIGCVCISGPDPIALGTIANSPNITPRQCSICRGWGGGGGTPWSPKQMLDDQSQRTDVLIHTRPVHDCLMFKGPLLTRPSCSPDDPVGQGTKDKRYCLQQSSSNTSPLWFFFII